MEKAKSYILSIDQSTSATKAMLFDRKAELYHRVGVPHQQYYPREGFVEHDPLDIFQNTLVAMEEVVAEAGIAASEIASIGLTNQRETAMIWDRNSGEPVSNAAVWQCQRGLEFCNQLKEEGWSQRIREKTGLLIDPYFSASKLHWMMTHLPGLRERARQGELLLGTMDSWLLWKLSGGKVHATDYSNACRTMLFNIHELRWDPELVELCQLHPTMLPELKFSDEVFAHTDPALAFGRSIPISGLVGDSHGALFGQQCYEPGVGKATYGTGSSVMMNIGKKALDPPRGLVTSIGFGMQGSIDYVFEGNIHCSGDTLNWLVKELQLVRSAGEAEELAATVDDNGGVYLVPAFVGLGAPYWDNQARAIISGLSRNSTRAHVCKAAMESIAYQVKDLQELMSSGAEVKLNELRVDGGPTRNNALMQFQADMLGGAVKRSNMEEVSALGAAFLAGLAVGFWQDLEEILSLRKEDRTFLPQLPEAQSGDWYEGWKAAVERSKHQKS